MMGLKNVGKFFRREAAHPAAGDAKPSNFDAQTATTTRLFSKLRRQKHEKLGKKVKSQLPPDEIVSKGTESEIEEPSPEQQQGQRQSTINPTKDDAKCPAVDTSADEGLSYKPSLWDRAYDTLRKDNVQLLEEYEALISREVQTYCPVSDRVYGPESQMSLESAGPLPDGSARLRRIQLDKIIDRGLRTTEERVTGCTGSVIGGTAEFLRSIKGFITQALSASPEASVAWAAVCLVLPLLTNHFDAEEANREGFTYTIHRMQYYSALEPLVFERDDHLNPSLKAAMEEHFERLYSALLEFQIRTVLRFYERIAKTFVKETFNPNAWKELRANIDKAEVLLNQDLEHVTASALLLEAKNRNELSKQHAADLQKLLLPLGDTATKIANTNEKQLQAEQAILVAVTEQSKFQQAEGKRKDEQKMSDEEMKCLQRLRLTNTDTYEVTKDRVEAHVQGTCQWVVRQQAFCQWMEQNSGPLLITADPGCGKSVLTKYLVDHHLPRESATICFFFFKEPHQTRISQALCAILHQLFVNKPTLLKKYAMDRLLRDPQGLVNTPSSLWTIFWQAVRGPEAGSIIVVMDALDECDPSDLKKFLVPDLHKNMAKSVNTKFLFTTRPYKFITSQFGRLEDVVPSYVKILGEDQCEDISKEVNLVIEHRVEEFAKENELQVDLKKKLRDMLLKIEHRTYLWVALLFDDLEYQSFKKTADGIEAAIRTLPTSVNEAYEKLLSRSTEHSTVRRALCLIVGAVRPLRVSDMKAALNACAGISPKDDHESENDFKDRLRQLCGLFVSFHEDIVYFFHLTAREFLLANPQVEPSVLVAQVHVDMQWKSSISAHQAHAELARACVQNLYMLTRDGFCDPREEHFNLNCLPFFTYSARNWEDHYRLSNGCIDDDLTFLTAALSIFHPQTTGFSTFFDLRYNSPAMDAVRRHYPNLWTPFRVASFTGCNAVVKHLFATGVDLEIEQHGGGGEWPAVQLAAGKGYFDTASLLLRLLPPNAAERIGDQPINESISKSISHRTDGTNPFAPGKFVTGAKIGNHHQYESMLHTLINNGFLNQPWEEGWAGGNLLAELAYHGRTDYISIVLKKYGGHAIQQQLHDIGLAIFPAVRSSQEKAIHMLLDYGDDIVEASSATSDKTQATVGCRGSHVILRTRQNGQTALHTALRARHPTPKITVVQLLLDRGACIEAVDDRGQTVLHDAATGSRVEMAQFFMDRGANPNAVDAKGRTVLHKAVSFRPEIQMVQCLVDGGADLKAVDADGRTAFHRAVLDSEADIVRFLLENGAELEATDKSGRTAFHMASQRGCEDVISVLIDKSTNIEAVDKFGRTPLHVACEWGKSNCVRLLLDSRANLEAHDNDGMTPLSVAASNGFPDAADLLVERGADPKVVVEAFRTIVTQIITTWLGFTWRLHPWKLEPRWMRSLRWCFQRAALVHSSSTGFQALLDQFVHDNEHELIDLMHHYDHLVLLMIPRDTREGNPNRILDEYDRLFQLLAEHGVNVKGLEEHAWKNHGVIVPISWLYGEDTRYLVSYHML